jgi:hypothetical protein
MIETVLLAMLAAKIKGYKLKPLFKDWAIYPAIIFTLFYIFLQITIFCGYYGFIKYAKLFETLYVFTFLTLIFKYGLYKSAFIGSVCIFIGTTLNKSAMAANGGRMPVFPTFSYITGYVKPESFLKVNDIHILGSQLTKLKFLTDYIDLGYSILSIGDIFIRLFTFIIIFNSIKYINKRK